MDKNKIINAFFWTSLLFAVLFGVYRFFISRNFVVAYQVDCDPTVEKCFVGYCDPSFGECTGNEEDDIWYYSKVKKMAFDVKKCNPNEEECADESICDQPITQKCWIEKCDENNLAEGEECSDPETYLTEHPEALEEDEEGLESEGEEAVEGEEATTEDADAVEAEDSDEISDEAGPEGTSESSEASAPEITPAVNASPIGSTPVPTPTSSAVPY